MRAISNIFSVIFHPLLVLTYMLILLLVTNPFAFGYRSAKDGDVLLLLVFLTSFVLPIIAVGITHLLGWIDSLKMPTRHERIAPLLIAFVMYLSLYLHITKANVFPWFFQVCTLGVLIALFLAFFLNNFTKISLHAVGMGGFVAMAILLMQHFSYAQVALNVPIVGDLILSKYAILFGIILVAGFVCTARLWLKAHTPQDVYGGFIAGFFAQLIAFLFLQ